MTAAKANVQANAVSEKVVINVMDDLKTACNHDISLSVMGWETQALHLAFRRQYARSELTYRGEQVNGDTLILVPADSQPGAYTVRVHPVAHPSCSCAAGRSNRPCKHSGAALALWAERMAETVERDEWDHLDHLSREDRRELAEVAYRYHTSRERRHG